MSASTDEVRMLNDACARASSPIAAALAALVMDGNKALEMHKATHTDLGRAFAIFIRHCTANLQVSEADLKAAVKARVHMQEVLAYLHRLPD